MSNKTVIFIVLLTLCYATLNFADDGQSDELTQLDFQELLSVQIGEKGKGVFVPTGYQANASTIHLGILVPLSLYPHYSTELIAAADIAASEINALGGIDGSPLAIVRVDDEGDPKRAASLANELIDQFNPVGIIGPLTTQRVREVVNKVTLKHQRPLISPTATANALYKGGKYHGVFRLIADNVQQGMAMSKFLKQRESHAKVVVVRGKSDYARELEDELKRELELIEGSIVKSFEFSRLVNYDKFDLTDVFEQLNKLQPDSIVIILPQDQVASFLNRLSQQKLTRRPLILTADSARPEKLIAKQLGSLGSCVYMVFSESKNADPKLQARISHLINSTTSTYDSAYIYDSVYLFAFALRYANQHGVSLEDALRTIASNGEELTPKDYANFSKLAQIPHGFYFNGMSGWVDFDKRGNNLAALVRIKPLFENSNDNCSPR